MLNKEVCKRCERRGLERFRWTEVDEELWREGKIMCYRFKDGKCQSFVERSRYKIAEDCPYFLEHRISVE